MLRTNIGQVLKHEAQESKAAFLEIVHFVRHHNWRQTLKWLFQRRFWKWWALLAVVIACSVTLSAFHEKIATAIHPWSIKIRHEWWTWIIPVVLLFIVSFPPLFGHELILLVCGMIWGLWQGFAIAAAGTFIGELGTYVAFKYFFREKARELEEKHIIYACCAKMMRDGGLPMLILVRFSAMPGHIVTAIQSCIGIGVWMYGIAAFVTLPKQFALVYLGKIFGDTVSPIDFNDMSDDQQAAQHEHETAVKHQQKKISFIVFSVTIIATGIAAYIVWMRARALRPTVIAEMEAKRMAREEAELEETAKTSEMRQQRSRNRDDLSLGDLRPPEFADLMKWNSSKAGLLMTPSKESLNESDKSNRHRSGSLGMSMHSPSLPHLPRYNSRLEDGEELLLKSRSRSGTIASRTGTMSSSSGSFVGPSSSLNIELRPPPPETEDYFGSVAAASSSSASLISREGSETPTVASELARRQSVPNWQKKDWL